MSRQKNGSARCQAGSGGPRRCDTRGEPGWRTAPTACQALAVDRSSVRHRSVPPDDAEARAAMKAVAAERRRFGSRRIHIMLERQGIAPLGRFGVAKSPAGQWMNLEKLRRLYREDGGGSGNGPGDRFPDDTPGAPPGRPEARPRCPATASFGNAMP